MKKVVILGAFDRYNYGDNLMPILFESFLREYYPGFFNSYHLEFSALTDSDLSKYRAKKTVAMSKVFEGRLDDIQAVISIGGEVLCASSSGLFFHMNHSKRFVRFVKLLKWRRFSFLADIVCKKFYKLPWEYPYIPQRLEPHIKVGFNTVGGGVSPNALKPYIHSVRARLSTADYLSVRDKRTEGSLKNFCSPEVFPDSAIVMAHFVNDDFLEKESGARINELRNEDYICFQAAPEKVDASSYECREVLRSLSEQYGLKIILCPIGYASGHDDIEFLGEVGKISDGEFEILDDLNVWEIMSVIRYSKAFIGTSLHGVITALSFSIPHVGVNRRVAKLDRFLADWSLGPSARCYSVLEIPDIFESVVNVNKAYFCAHSEHLIELGLKNNHRLVQALSLDNQKAPA
jgi:hypothetical protein